MSFSGSLLLTFPPTHDQTLSSSFYSGEPEKVLWIDHVLCHCTPWLDFSAHREHRYYNHCLLSYQIFFSLSLSCFSLGFCCLPFPCSFSPTFCPSKWLILCHSKNNCKNMSLLLRPSWAMILSLLPWCYMAIVSLSSSLYFIILFYVLLLCSVD